MQHEAESRALTGWVRNLPDGRVEASVEGEPAQVDSLIAWCGDGPSGARVTGVEIHDEPPAGGKSFDIVA
jgi:acylphosphatase